jgi:hypothetical protein
MPPPPPPVFGAFLTAVIWAFLTAVIWAFPAAAPHTPPQRVGLFTASPRLSGSGLSVAIPNADRKD